MRKAHTSPPSRGYANRGQHCCIFEGDAGGGENKSAGRVLHSTSATERLSTATAPDAILTIDEACTILSANSAVRRIFGYEPDALAGQSLGVLIPERLRERHFEGMARYLATGKKRLDWTGARLMGLSRSRTKT